MFSDPSAARVTVLPRSHQPATPPSASVGQLVPQVPGRRAAGSGQRAAGSGRRKIQRQPDWRQGSPPVPWQLCGPRRLGPGPAGRIPGPRALRRHPRRPFVDSRPRAPSATRGQGSRRRILDHPDAMAQAWKMATSWRTPSSDVFQAAPGLSGRKRTSSAPCPRTRRSIHVDAK
jgi:hypothetical protein